MNTVAIQKARSVTIFISYSHPKMNENIENDNPEFKSTHLMKKYSLDPKQIQALESDIFLVMKSETTLHLNNANLLSGTDIPFSDELELQKQTLDIKCTATESKSPCCGKQQIEGTDHTIPTTTNRGTSKEPVSEYSIKNKTDKLLPPKSSDDQTKNTLVIDLDETLIHSSFTHISTPDFTFTLTAAQLIDISSDEKKKLSDNSSQQDFTIYVRIRPFAKEFIERLGDIYEIIIFSNSNKVYTDEVLKHVDPNHKIKYVLYQESIFEFNGALVKDLSRLGRELSKTIILDNNQMSYLLQPYNAIQICTWFRNKNDSELTKIMDFLVENEKETDVYSFLVQK